MPTSENWYVWWYIYDMTLLMYPVAVSSLRSQFNFPCYDDVLLFTADRDR